MIFLGAGAFFAGVLELPSLLAFFINCPLCANSFCLRLVLSFQLRLSPVELRSIALSAATILEMKMHDGAVLAILAQPGDYLRPPARVHPMVPRWSSLYSACARPLRGSMRVSISAPLRGIRGL